MKRLNRAEAIANVIGWDIQDVKENLYQHGRTSTPVYTIGSNYYCVGNKPAQFYSTEFNNLWNWKLVDNYINNLYGWQVWVSTN